MINVKITMVDGKAYNISNEADSITQFFKNVIAPYGNTTGFIEVIPGELINTSNIVGMRQLTELEIQEIEERNKLPNPEIVSDAPVIEENVVARPQDVPEIEA